MAQHQSQCSIFANQRLKVSNIFLCSCCFRRSLSGFRSVANRRSSTRLHIVFTKQSFQPFSGNFTTIVRYPKPSFRYVSIRALSSCDILTYRLNCDYDLKYRYGRIYYNAMLQINIKNNDVTTKVVLVAQSL